MDPAAAYMLLPYFGWSAFATALTLKITALNSGSGKVWRPGLLAGLAGLGPSKERGSVFWAAPCVM